MIRNMGTLERYGIPAGYGRDVLFRRPSLIQRFVQRKPKAQPKEKAELPEPLLRTFRVEPSAFAINGKTVDEHTFRREVRKAIVGRTKGQRAVLITQ